MWARRPSKRGSSWWRKRRPQETVCFSCRKPGDHFLSRARGYSCWAPEEVARWERMWDIGDSEYSFDGED